MENRSVPPDRADRDAGWAQASALSFLHIIIINIVVDFGFLRKLVVDQFSFFAD